MPVRFKNQVIPHGEILVHLQGDAKFPGIVLKGNVHFQLAAIGYAVQKQTGVAAGRVHAGSLFIQNPGAGQRTHFQGCFRGKGVVHSFGGLHGQGTVGLLHQLMHDHGAAPIPGVVILAFVLFRVEMPHVLFPKGVPAVHVMAFPVGTVFRRVEAAGVEGINLRGNPRALGGAGHAVQRFKTVRIHGIGQIPPIAPLEQVGAFMAGLVRGRGVKRFADRPMAQVFGFAQAHAALAHGNSFFLGAQQHPPAAFFFIPDHVRIAPVGHFVNHVVRLEGFFRQFPPFLQILTDGVAHVLTHVGRKGELAVEHMVYPVHLEHRPRAAVYVRPVLIIEMQLIPRGNIAPSKAQIK